MLAAWTTAMEYATLPSNASGSFKPFEVHIPEENVAQLKSLLELSRIGPPTYENSVSNRQLGVSYEWLVHAVHAWKTDFSWRNHEQYYNSFPSFTTEIRDDDSKTYQMHFVGLFSARSDAIPLMLLHGWPGSFIEFLPMLDRLRQQFSPETLPYHLVVPSLPGYTFSSPPPLNRDFQLEDVARLLHKLALSLGFGTGYVLQGGDIGSKVSRVMAATYNEVKAVHINFCIMKDPGLPLSEQNSISAAEAEGLVRAKDFERVNSAYATEHATKPATIGFILSSSPIALLAWIGEKFLDWTDDDLPLEKVLESVSLYWLTNCASTCIYPYRQLFTPGEVKAHEHPPWHIHKPLGYSFFPKELAPIPRTWAATTGNLVFYRQHTSGGHFAAIEKTEELWTDIQDFIEQVWK